MNISVFIGTRVNLNIEPLLDVFVFVLYLTSRQQLVRSYGDRPWHKVSSNKLVKPGIEPATSGLQGKRFIQHKS